MPASASIDARQFRAPDCFLLMQAGIRAHSKLLATANPDPNSESAQSHSSKPALISSRSPRSFQRQDPRNQLRHPPARYRPNCFSARYRVTVNAAAPAHAHRDVFAGDLPKSSPCSLSRCDWSATAGYRPRRSRSTTVVADCSTSTAHPAPRLTDAPCSFTVSS